MSVECHPFCTTFIFPIMPFTFFINALAYSKGTNTPVVTIDPTPCIELPPTYPGSFGFSQSQNSCASKSSSEPTCFSRSFSNRGLSHGGLSIQLSHIVERILAVICLSPSSLCSNRDCNPWFYDNLIRLQPIRNWKFQNKSITHLNVDYARYYLWRGVGYEGSEILQISKCLFGPPKTWKPQDYSLVLMTP